MSKKKSSEKKIKTTSTTSADASKEVFDFFTEIGIINQLSTNLLSYCLPDGVHPSHFAIINHLYRVGDGQPPLKLASAMQVTKTTMSHSLKVLEDKALITLNQNPDDARSKQVFLTKKGRRFQEKAIQEVAGTFAELLSEEHVNAMRKAMPELRQIRVHLDVNRPE